MGLHPLAPVRRTTYLRVFPGTADISRLEAAGFTYRDESANPPWKDELPPERRYDLFCYWDIRECLGVDAGPVLQILEGSGLTITDAYLANTELRGKSPRSRTIFVVKFTDEQITPEGALRTEVERQLLWSFKSIHMVALSSRNPRALTTWLTFGKPWGAKPASHAICFRNDAWTLRDSVSRLLMPPA